MKALVAAISFVFVFMSAISEVQARMPSNYDPVSLDVALERAKTDGRPIMIYFGEDW